MAVKKIPARDIIVQVHDGETPGTWMDIKGLTAATINPAENEEVVDATTFGSDGHYEQLVMQRGASITLEGFKLQDPDTGDLDPGQERCEELATETGVASLGSIRFRHPMDSEWRVWPEATFSLGEQGGGNNDLVSWSCTIVRSGPSETDEVTS